jgi:N-acetylmuramoyl-L-alanine amidase
MAEQTNSQAPQPGSRRKPRRASGIVDVVFVTLRSIVIVVFAASLAATIFSWWTASDFLPQAARDDLSVAIATGQAQITPTLLPTETWQQRIGIVAGHRGYDPGAVCEDGTGLTEAEVNYEIAQLVVQDLRARGYTVDLLDEFDDRLEGYQASLLVSIHADSCEYINDFATGFKVTTAESRMADSAQDRHLVQCMIDHYGAVTGLPLHPSITDDMTSYHGFDEVWPRTPAIIIEVGFMYMDRGLLEGQPNVVAQGIIDGVMCYLETPYATPTPPFTLPTETPAPQ